MFIAFLVSSAFAVPLANCDVKDYPDQVAKVWWLAENGRKTADGMVFLGDGNPQYFEYVPDYRIQTVDGMAYVGLIGWYPMPAGSEPPGQIVPLIVQMTRDGTLIDAPKGRDCAKARTLAINFFTHLPK